MTPIVTAGECSYGLVHAWFRTGDDTWINATVHPMLKRCEEFEITVMVTAKTELQVIFLKLHEFGTPVFEALKGPTAIEQLLECRQKILPNQTFTYLWRIRVRPETTWVNGYAPLEVFVQFNKNDIDEERIGFDVITAFIIDDVWVDSSKENNTNALSAQDTNAGNLPDFDFGKMFIAMFLVCLYWKIRHELL
jgi:sarcinarray family protein